MDMSCLAWSNIFLLSFCFCAKFFLSPAITLVSLFLFCHMFHHWFGLLKEKRNWARIGSIADKYWEIQFKEKLHLLHFFSHKYGSRRVKCLWMLCSCCARVIREMQTVLTLLFTINMWTHYRCCWWSLCVQMLYPLALIGQMMKV